MNTLARSVYLESEFGVAHDLPNVGSALENPYVFDASAKELKALAAKGLIEIVDEHCSMRSGETLFDRLKFIRRR